MLDFLENTFIHHEKPTNRFVDRPSLFDVLVELVKSKLKQLFEFLFKDFSLHSHKYDYPIEDDLPHFRFSLTEEQIAQDRIFSIPNSRKQSFFTVVKEGRIEKVEAKPAVKPTIPPSIKKDFTQWVADHQASFSAKKDRVPYSQDQIADTLSRFETECHCHWHTMKSKWGSTHLLEMQIINDLRSMHIETISAQLRQEFALKIYDFGSCKLTSDRDISISIEQNRDKEVDAVARYNELFASMGWGSTTSTYIFDNNCYTQLYIDTLNLSENQKIQSTQQYKMSLVMFYRNAGLCNWVKLKDSILKHAPQPQHQELKKLFTLVENVVHELERKRNAQIIHTHLCGQSPTGMLDATSVAAQIAKQYPESIVASDNALHDEYKQEVKTTIGQKTTLNQCLMEMQQVSATPKEAFNAYKRAVKHMTSFVDAQIERLQLQRAYLHQEAGLIGSKDPKKATALRESSQQLKHQIDVLEADKDKILESLLTLDPTVFATTAKKWGEAYTESCKNQKILRYLDNLPLKLDLLQKEQLQLESAQKDSNSNTIKAKLKKNYATLCKHDTQWKNAVKTRQTLVAKLNATTKTISELPQSDVKCIESVLQKADEMQLAIELYSMKAQCFAQEAHVTAGAFGFVVIDLQKGEKNPRSIEEYLQAINELMGFYFAHQNPAHSAHENLIEISKYAVRLMKAYECMQKQAQINGLKFPEIRNLTALKVFFGELQELRGGKIHDHTLARGLNGVQEIQKIKGRLLKCKSKDQAKALLEKHKLQDHFSKIECYYPTSSQGGLAPGQMDLLVREIGGQFYFPFNKSLVDAQRITACMLDIQSQVNAWAWQHAR